MLTAVRGSALLALLLVVVAQGAELTFYHNSQACKGIIIEGAKAKTCFWSTILMMHAKAECRADHDGATVSFYYNTDCKTDLASTLTMEEGCNINMEGSGISIFVKGCTEKLARGLPATAVKEQDSHGEGNRDSQGKLNVPLVVFGVIAAVALITFGVIVRAAKKRNRIYPGTFPSPSSQSQSSGKDASSP